MIPFGYYPLPPLMRDKSDDEEYVDYEKPVTLRLAHAYIKDQPYENFFPLGEALLRGTIFKDLYFPYRTI